MNHSKTFNRVNLVAAIALGAVTAISSNASRAASTSIDGYWQFTDDATLVSIEACGAVGVCARVVESKPGAPACATVLIDSIAPTQDRKSARFTGKVIDPDTRSRYDAKLKRIDENNLELVVSAIGGLVSESYMMKRSVAPLKPCVNKWGSDANSAGKP